jgi:hypothetical protein
MDGSNERASELLDIIAERFQCSGIDAKLLLLDAVAEVKKFPAPKEKWVRREDSDENPDEFIRRVWEPLSGKYEVTTSDIRKHDPNLYMDWNNWKRFNTSNVELKTRSEVNETVGDKIAATIEREVNAYRSRKQHRRRTR